MDFLPVLELHNGEEVLINTADIVKIAPYINKKTLETGITVVTKNGRYIYKQGNSMGQRESLFCLAKLITNGNCLKTALITTETQDKSVEEDTPISDICDLYLEGLHKAMESTQNYSVFLDLMALFSKASLINLCLIFAQNPNAQELATKEYWETVGNGEVLPNESGMKLYLKDKSQSDLIFDIDQTTIKYDADKKTADDPIKTAMDFASSNGYKLIVTEMEGRKYFAEGNALYVNSKLGEKMCLWYVVAYVCCQIVRKDDLGNLILLTSIIYTILKYYGQEWVVCDFSDALKLSNDEFETLVVRVKTCFDIIIKNTDDEPKKSDVNTEVYFSDQD